MEHKIFIFPQDACIALFNELHVAAAVANKPAPKAAIIGGIIRYKLKKAQPI